jgi:hypothetical protein
MTKAPRVTKTPRTPRPGSKGPQKIYRRVVYARVTDEEWSLIQLRSDQAGLSMSRYLVETGLRGKTPPTRADRARLQFLLYQFRRAAIALNQVAADRLVMAVGGSETRQLLRETASLLEQLAQELTRRMSAPIPEEKAGPPSDPESDPERGT